MTPRLAGTLGCLLAVLVAGAGADGPKVHPGDAKAYRFLNDTKRLPRLDRGNADRTLAFTHWQPTPRQADDPALAEPGPRLQVLDATCDADLVVIARVESAVPFQHPNGRWVLTAHELAVSRVVRTHAPKVRPPERVRYVHPSGQLTIAERAVRTTVDRFPTIVSDEEALFFLVGIGGSAYRTSLLLPPMAMRGGILDAFGIVPPGGAREPAAGLGARDAVRLAADAVCRPAPIDHDWRRPSTDTGRLPPLPPRLDAPP